MLNKGKKATAGSSTVYPTKRSFLVWFYLVEITNKSCIMKNVITEAFARDADLFNGWFIRHITSSNKHFLALVLVFL